MILVMLFGNTAWLVLSPRMRDFQVFEYYLLINAGIIVQRLADTICVNERLL